MARNVIFLEYQVGDETNAAMFKKVLVVFFGPSDLMCLEDLKEYIGINGFLSR